jgi:hypothetical protein
MINQVSDHAPIIRLEKVLQRQAGEELMLRKLLRTTGVRVSR